MQFIRRLAIGGAQIYEFLRGEERRPLVAWLYKLQAPFYGELLPDDYEEVAGELVTSLDVTPGERVLDLGCGTGALTIAARQHTPQVTGLDYSPDMLRKLRDRAPDIRLIRADMRDLPYPTATFDKVVTSFTLLHLSEEEKRQTFMEARRVLKPGGLLGCMTSRKSIAPIYPAADDWHGWLAPHYNDVTLHEIRDIYRFVTARA